ncbi:unnamed protein product [Prorocentrum cordatum]|uniref:Uncharacterized protein n=1 Tax=Prorocentrum cordatum TaxID=2364126 RepID=A0ABN9XM46_9DINO|nr:unnamed protein product [Polarella glacialis]
MWPAAVLVEARTPALRHSAGMARCRANWSEPDAAAALACLILDEEKGNPHRQHPLPRPLYSDSIASFLHFDDPVPNQLYVIGGRNRDHGPLDTVEMFDTWNGCWVQCPSMSARRAGCAAAVLRDQRILCMGGYDVNGIVQGLLATCEAFDPIQEAWDASVADMERARWGHGCAAMDGLVYVVGGCSLQPGAPPEETFMETLRSCEVYDPGANTWRPTADLQFARAGSRVVAIGTKYLAAVGGCDDVFGRAQTLSSVELFDITACRWTLLDVHLTTPRTTAAVASVEGRGILVIGGAPSLSTSEVCRLRVPADTGEVGGEQTSALAEPEATGALPALHVGDISEGRMGCQAAVLQLPAPGANYPLCSRTCVVVVGGENGEEELEQADVRQFDSVLVYDAEECVWLPGEVVPPMLAPRTAMAVCVGCGYVRGYPSRGRKDASEPVVTSRGGS